MSEVNDAIQIIMTAGKGAYLLSGITIKAAAGTMKTLNTIYLSKWRGKVELNRLRQIKGDDFLFVNVATEDKKILKEIEREMKEHGILFARMPDLCGGDGQTQYAMAVSEVSKLKSMMLDHHNGKYGYVLVGPIKPLDYTQTGMTKDGKTTREMEELTESIQKGNKRTTDGRSKKKNAASKENGELITTLGKEMWEDGQVSLAIRLHERGSTNTEELQWIKDKPLVKEEVWNLYVMPDGRYAVVVPKKDIFIEYVETETGRKEVESAAVFPEKAYTMIDLSTRRVSSIDGRMVCQDLKTEDLMAKNRELKNLLKNLEKGNVVLQKVKERGAL